MEGKQHTIEYDIHTHVRVLMDSEADMDRVHDHGHRTQLDMGCRCGTCEKMNGHAENNDDNGR